MFRAVSSLYSRDKVKAFESQKDKAGGNPNYLSYIAYTHPKTKKKTVKAQSKKSKKTDQPVDDRKRKATARARRAIKGF